jgi:hypothetical protein
MDSKAKKLLLKEYTKEAKNSEWCDLAFSIIVLENCIREEKNPKCLKILKLKLEVFEGEKTSRVFDTFDMQHFLSKDFQDVDEFTFE